MDERNDSQKLSRMKETELRSKGFSALPCLSILYSFIVAVVQNMFPFNIIIMYKSSSIIAQLSLDFLLSSPPLFIRVCITEITNLEEFSFVILQLLFRIYKDINCSELSRS